MPKGLFQRGKYIHMRYYDPYLGRTTSESTGFIANPENIKLAKAYREQKLKELQSLTFIPITQFITIQDAMKEFLSKKEYAPSTSKLLQLAVDDFIKVNGNMIITNITDVEDSKLKKYWIDNDFKKNTRSIYSRALYAMFNYFVKLGIMQKNPIVRASMENIEVKIIPQKDLDEILEYLEKENKEGYYLIKFLYYTGLRISEAISLKWNDISLEEATMRFWNQKSKRYDKRPLLEQAIELLYEIKMNTPKREKVFLYTNKSCLFFYRAQARLWGERDKKGNLKKQILRRYHLHQLRKTFITKLVMSGVAITDTQVFSGHKDARTTTRYYVEYHHKQIAKKVSQLVNF
jgi:integrase/recombinase XerD